MSTGETRGSQSAISFNVVKKHGEISNKRPGKILRRDMEDLTLEIMVSQDSASAITIRTHKQGNIPWKQFKYQHGRR